MKFKFDELGRTPHGYTVTNPPKSFASVDTAVTFNATAATSLGTPFSPATCNSYAEPLPSNSPTFEPEERVSNNRSGFGNDENDGPTGSYVIPPVTSSIHDR